MVAVALYTLAVILTIQQGLDYVSTKLVISKGRGREGNKLMAEWMKIAGPYWWTIKVPLVAMVWGMVFYFGPVPMLVAMLAVLACVYTYVIINNYQIAWRQ